MTELTPTGRLKLLGPFSELISAAIKELLEKKHLYQSVTLDLRGLLAHITNLAKEIEIIGNIGWMIPEDHPSINTKATTSGAVAVQAAQSVVWLKAPDVKLFCEECDRVEAFNSVATHILVSSVEDNSLAVQVFAFSFLCQSCKSIPEVFIVRREKLKLILCGRAPIERVDVPSVIPRSVESHYSDALIACHCGFTLMGNFGLRTLVEQWARAATGITTRIDGDKLLEQYGDILPPNFSSLYPSLRSLYSDLSADIHKASGDLALFERGIEDIEKHFTGLRSVSTPLNPGIVSALARKKTS